MSSIGQILLISRRTVLVAILFNFFLFGVLYLSINREYIPELLLMRPPAPVTEKNYQGLWQGDRRLISYIRSLLHPPSTKPYGLKKPKQMHFSSGGQSGYLGKIYGPGKRNGFFVEVGAMDGETASNSLYFEKSLGFTGLLIEAQPQNYQVLIRKNRKAYCLYAALSPTPLSAELKFSGSAQVGHLIKGGEAETIRVKAFPFYSIISALNVSFIDIFSLDIEGFEFKVLKTIPFDKIKFGVLIVEHKHIPENKTELVQFMAALGYSKIHANIDDYFFADLKYMTKLPGWKTS